jgi:hypothetical protein
MTSGPGHTRRLRHNLRAWVLEQFGDGLHCLCTGCGIALTDDTMTLDRYPLPGKYGGGYTRENVRPQCAICNSSHEYEPNRYRVDAVYRGGF